MVHVVHKLIINKFSFNIQGPQGLYISQFYLHAFKSLEFYKCFW